MKKFAQEQNANLKIKDTNLWVYPGYDHDLNTSNYMNNEKNDIFRAAKIGIVYQQNNLLADFTALENIYLASLSLHNDKKLAISKAICTIDTEHRNILGQNMLFKVYFIRHKRLIYHLACHFIV